MKWAKTKSELAQIRKRLAKLGPSFNGLKNPGKKLLKDLVDCEVRQYYEELEDELTIRSLHKKGFGEWLVVPKNEMPRKYEKARARYEAFVGGYLYYFENHVSENQDNRVLYFDWGIINKKAGLTIFMAPLHVKEPKTPVDAPDNGNNYAKSEPDTSVNGNGNGNGKHYQNQNGQDVLEIFQNKLGKKGRKVIIASPPAGGRESTDPPPPPAPPPPPRE
jgi:hypothetical protein